MTKKNKTLLDKIKAWIETQSRLQLILKGVGTIVAFGVLFVISLILMVRIGMFGALPSYQDLKDIRNYTASEVYTKDGVLMGKYYIENRTNVNYSDISPFLIDALVATEDSRFFQHRGVDMRAIFRVLFKTVLGGNSSSGGGSTLSQQLVKNLFPRKRYRLFSTPIAKFREMFIARRLEKLYSKKELLNLYLNTVPFGGNEFGVNVAARHYFNTSPKEIKIEQAATLIGMLKANTSYNPIFHPEKSKKRRNVVLKQMQINEYITKVEYDSLKILPIVVEPNMETADDGLGSYFRSHLRLELVELLKDHEKPDGSAYNLYTDGLRIYTTIDSRMQTYAESAVEGHLSKLQQDFDKHWKGKKKPWENDKVLDLAIKRSRRYKSLKRQKYSHKGIMKRFREPVEMTVFDWKEDMKQVTMTPLDSVKYYFGLLNAGFLAMDPKDGAIKAWVGGINHKFFQYDHVKARRPVGSTFKPVVYAAALEQGMDPCEYIDNRLVTYTEYDDWQPRNAENHYSGVYTMMGGLAHSVNTIAVSVLMKTGIKPIMELAKKMGMNSKIPEVPAIALGAIDASLKEMVNIYATIDNEGQNFEPYYLLKVETADGNVIAEFEPTPPEEVQQALRPETAQMITRMLEDVVNNGTGTRLRRVYGFTTDMAGKTGTTQNQSDGWYIGYTPRLVAGAWVGGESPVVRFKSLRLGSGANMALPIWGEFMRKVATDKKLRYFVNAQFPEMNDTLSMKMACAPYLEERPSTIIDSLERMTTVEKLDELLGSILNEKKPDRVEKKRKRRKVKTKSDRSIEIRKKNEKKKKKRERKKRRKKFFDKILGRD